MWYSSKKKDQSVSLLLISRATRRFIVLPSRFLKRGKKKTTKYYISIINPFSRVEGAGKKLHLFGNFQFQVGQSRRELNPSSRILEIDSRISIEQPPLLPYSAGDRVSSAAYRRTSRRWELKVPKPAHRICRPQSPPLLARDLFSNWRNLLERDSRDAPIRRPRDPSDFYEAANIAVISASFSARKDSF